MPIPQLHIAHYSHSHLGLCRKHFAIASKITISGIEAGFAVLYSFTWQFKAEKEQQSFIYLLLRQMAARHTVIRTRHSYTKKLKHKTTQK